TITAMSTATAVFRRIIFRLSFSPSRVVSRRSRWRGERIVFGARRGGLLSHPFVRASYPHATAERARIVDNPLRVRHRDLTKVSCARVACRESRRGSPNCVDKDRTMK